MTAHIEPILKEVSWRLGFRVFDDVHKFDEGLKVADETEKFILRVGFSKRFILIVSNAISPTMVRRNVERMEMAQELLSDDTKQAIELPLMQGEYEDRTYALWVMRKPLSTYRVLRKIQKISISPSIIRWINTIAVQTLHHGNSNELASYMERLLRISALPEHIKKSAARARLGILSGEIAPLQILQHGDLWIGNILKAPNPLGFIVVDWAGATLNGLPFFDLVTFACSMGTTPSRLFRYIHQYSQLIECDITNALPYVLASLGRLHFELEYFPQNKFIGLCEQRIGALQSALLASGNAQIF